MAPRRSKQLVDLRPNKCSRFEWPASQRQTQLWQDWRRREKSSTALAEGTTCFDNCIVPWTVIAELLRRIRAMEMRCYLKILRISYKDHETDEEVCAKIQQTIGPHEDLTIVKRRKLKWYGHVSCLSGLAKTTLQGTGKGGRRKGRQI